MDEPAEARAASSAAVPDAVPDTGPDAGPDSWPGISVVMCVRNESRHLRQAVHAVLDQDYPGEIEVVVAVGPSRDDTHAIAAHIAGYDARVRVVTNPTGFTPAGLNRAVAASSFPVIARVDGHALLPPGYLRCAVSVLAQTRADNVGGIMAAEGETAFEQAVAAAMTSWFGVGGARFHIGGEPGPADTVYLGVFRRETLDKVGGYDESFIRAQDWELNYRIREEGGLVWFTPELRVSYRPRSTLESLARQYYHYGRWRREVMRRHPGSVAPRYLAPPAALLGCLVGLAGAAAGRRRALVLPGGYAAVLLAGSAAVGRGLPRRVAVRLPAVLATMHLSWGGGFLVGSAVTQARKQQARRQPRQPGGMRRG